MSNERVLIQKNSDLAESVRTLSNTKKKLEQDIIDLSDSKKTVVSQMEAIQSTLKARLELINTIQEDSELERVRLIELNNHLVDKEKLLKIEQEDWKRDMSLIENLLERDKVEAQSKVEELELKASNLKETIKELQDEQELLNEQNDSILSNIELQNYINAVGEQSIKHIEEKIQELQNTHDKTVKEYNDKIEKKQKELVEQGDVDKSIRTELRNKEIELKEREDNLIILQSRLQSQIKEYFPHINIKI